MKVTGKKLFYIILYSGMAIQYLQLTHLPYGFFTMAQNLASALMCFYALCNLDIFFLKRYLPMNLMVTIYVFGMFLANYMNHSVTSAVMRALLLHLGMCPLIEAQMEYRHLNFFMKTLLVWFSVNAVLNDVLMVLLPGTFAGDGIRMTYWVGNKFSVCYLHLWILMLVYMLYHEARWFKAVFYPLWAFCILVSILVDCNTMMLGFSGFLIMLHLPKGIFKMITTRKIFFATIIISAVFFFIMNPMTNPIINHLVVNVLHRSPSMTGRTEIYGHIPNVIKGSPIWGYGDNNRVIHDLAGAYNTQNGFFELVVNYGLITAFWFVLVMVIFYKQMITARARALIATLFIYVVLSSVEITYYSLIFFLEAFLIVEYYRASKSIPEYCV